MEALDLIFNFPELVSQYISLIGDGNKKRMYFLDDMENLIGRVRSAKLNGKTIQDMRKAREWSSCRGDEYFTKIDGLDEFLFANVKADVTTGMDATIVLYSDTYGCQITDVKRNKKGNVNEVTVRKYGYEVKDWQDGECELNRNILGTVEHTFTLRRGGGWYAKGEPKAMHSVKLAVGHARTYRDPSF